MLEGRNHRHQDDKAGVGHHPRHLSGTTDIFRAGLIIKTQTATKAEAQLIAVD